MTDKEFFVKTTRETTVWKHGGIGTPLGWPTILPSDSILHVTVIPGGAYDLRSLDQPDYFIRLRYIFSDEYVRATPLEVLARV